MTPQQERWLAIAVFIVGVVLVVGLMLSAMNPRKDRK